MRRGFTLVELLVVILIIGLITVVALPVVLPALRSRQSRGAARLLTSAIAGCRDRAIRDGAPAGLRLIPDPAFPVARLADGAIDPSAPLAFGSWVPIAPAPEYTEGRVTILAGAQYAAAVTNPAGGSAGTPALVLEAAPLDSGGAPNPPTSWAWNLRVGDRIQIAAAGPWYTIVGPDWTGAAGGNSERFINWGPPGTASPLNPTGAAPVEWLLLVNGRDDNQNGWRDEGWDGVDNDGDGLVDEATCAVSAAGEWEAETWQGAAAGGLASVPYAVRRRPAPTSAAVATALPTQVVVDAARSVLPVDRYAGTAEILVQPDGSVTTQTVYGVPSSIGMGGSWLHFWLAERADVGTAPGTTPAGEWGLVSINTRTGRVSALEDPDPATAITQAQQGATD